MLIIVQLYAYLLRQKMIKFKTSKCFFPHTISVQILETNEMAQMTYFRSFTKFPEHLSEMEPLTTIFHFALFQLLPAAHRGFLLHSPHQEV